MRGRPILIGAVFLLTVLLAGNYLGVPDQTPPLVKQFEDLQTGSRLSNTVKLQGRIRSREQMSGGIRFCLNHIIFLKEISNSDFNNNSISDQNSFKQIYEEQNQKRDQVLARWKEELQVQVYFDRDQSQQMELAALNEGDWVLVSGQIELPERASNPGQYDARQYQNIRNIYLIVKKGKLRSYKKTRQNLSSVMSGIRSALSDSCEAVMGSRDAGVISSMILGDRSGLPAELKTLYQEGGIAHILAISSLHVTMLGMSMYQLLRKLRRSFAVSAVLSAALVLGYCIMSGMSVSAVRAGIMFFMWLGSQMAGRTNDRLTALSLAAAVILLDRPKYLRDAGFLLSFGCILSLEFLTPMIQAIGSPAVRMVAKAGRRQERRNRQNGKGVPVRVQLLVKIWKTGQALSVSAAISMGTLPIVMYFFFQITPYAVLVNLLVIPAMTLVMGTGIAASVIGLLYPVAGAVAAAPCHYLLALFEHICRLERKLPGAVLITGRPRIWQIIVYYILLILACLFALLETVPVEEHTGHMLILSGKPDRKRKKVSGKRIAALIGMLSAAVTVLFWKPQPRLCITFLDVGQGDSILIQSGSFSCLIDGGSSSVEQVWKYRIGSALKYYGISSLDAVFLSHGDQDHTNGVEQMLEAYERDWLGNGAGGITVKQILIPDTGGADDKLDRIEKIAGEQGIRVGKVKRGSEIRCGKLRLSCHHPDPGKSSGDANEDSMVLLLEYENIAALFTGDLELKGEEEFCSYFVGLWGGRQLDLLKVGHHGSKNATSEKLLGLLSPAAAVISCGENNRYGHPASEVLDRLSQKGTDIYRTDRQGAVQAVWRGGRSPSLIVSGYYQMQK